MECLRKQRFQDSLLTFDSFERNFCTKFELLNLVFPARLMQTALRIYTNTLSSIEKHLLTQLLVSFRAKFSASDQRSLTLLSYFSTILMNEELCKPSKDSSSVRMTSLLSCIPYQIPWSCLAIHVLHTEVMMKQ